MEHRGSWEKLIWITTFSPLVNIQVFSFF